MVFNSKLSGDLGASREQVTSRGLGIDEGSAASPNAALSLSLPPRTSAPQQKTTAEIVNDLANQLLSLAYQEGLAGTADSKARAELHKAIEREAHGFPNQLVALEANTYKRGQSIRFISDHPAQSFAEFSQQAFANGVTEKEFNQLKGESLKQLLTQAKVDLTRIQSDRSEEGIKAQAEAIKKLSDARKLVNEFAAKHPEIIKLDELNKQLGEQSKKIAEQVAEQQKQAAEQGQHWYTPVIHAVPKTVEAALTLTVGNALYYGGGAVGFVCGQGWKWSQAGSAFTYGLHNFMNRHVGGSIFGSDAELANSSAITLALEANVLGQAGAVFQPIMSATEYASDKVLHWRANQMAGRELSDIEFQQAMEESGELRALRIGLSVTKIGAAVALTFLTDGAAAGALAEGESAAVASAAQASLAARATSMFGVSAAMSSVSAVGQEMFSSQDAHAKHMSFWQHALHVVEHTFNESANNMLFMAGATALSEGVVGLRHAGALKAAKSEMSIAEQQELRKAMSHQVESWRKVMDVTQAMGGLTEHAKMFEQSHNWIQMLGVSLLLGSDAFNAYDMTIAKHLAERREKAKAEKSGEGSAPLPVAELPSAQKTEHAAPHDRSDVNTAANLAALAAIKLAAQQSSSTPPPPAPPPPSSATPSLGVSVPPVPTPPVITPAIVSAQQKPQDSSEANKISDFFTEPHPDGIRFPQSTNQGISTNLTDVPEYVRNIPFGMIADNQSSSASTESRSPFAYLMVDDDGAGGRGSTKSESSTPRGVEREIPEYQRPEELDDIAATRKGVDEKVSGPHEEQPIERPARTEELHESVSPEAADISQRDHRHRGHRRRATGLEPSPEVSERGERDKPVSSSESTDEPRTRSDNPLEARVANENSFERFDHALLAAEVQRLVESGVISSDRAVEVLKAMNGRELLEEIKQAAVARLAVSEGRTQVGTLADGTPVWTKKGVDHLKAHPEVLRLLPEALAEISAADFKDRTLDTEVNMGRIVGQSTCVETTSADSIVFGKRSERAVPTRFVVGREGEACSTVAIRLYRNDDGIIAIMTAYVGELSPPEPASPTAIKNPDLREEGMRFWANHAIALGKDSIDPSLVTTDSREFYGKADTADDLHRFRRVIERNCDADGLAHFYRELSAFENSRGNSEAGEAYLRYAEEVDAAKPEIARLESENRKIETHIAMNDWSEPGEEPEPWVGRAQERIRDNQLQISRLLRPDLSREIEALNLIENGLPSGVRVDLVPAASFSEEPFSAIFDLVESLTWRELFGDDVMKRSDEVVVVRNANGAGIAYASILPAEHLDDANSKPMIHGLYTPKEFRGNRYGRIAGRAAVELLRLRGHRAIEANPLTEGSRQAVAALPEDLRAVLTTDTAVGDGSETSGGFPRHTLRLGEGEEIVARYNRARGDLPDRLFVRSEDDVQRIVHRIALSAGESASEAARLAQQVSAFYYQSTGNEQVDAFMRELGIASGTTIAPDAALGANRSERVSRAARAVHEIEHARGGDESAADSVENDYRREQGLPAVQRDAEAQDTAEKLHALGIQPATREDRPDARAGVDRLLYALKYETMDHVMQARNARYVTAEAVHDVEVQTLALATMAEGLQRRLYREAVGLRDAFELPVEAVQSIAREEFVRRLTSRNLEHAIRAAFELRNRFGLADDVLPSAVNEALASRLEIRGTVEEQNREFDGAVKIRDAFGLSNAVVQSGAIDGLIFRLGIRDVDGAIRIYNDFELPAEAIRSEIVLSAVTKCAEELLKRSKESGIAEVVNMRDQLQLSAETFYAAGELGVINAIGQFGVDRVLKIRDALGLPLEVMRSEEALGAFANSACYELISGNIEKAESIQKSLEVPEERMDQAVCTAIIFCVEIGQVERAASICKHFGCENLKPVEDLKYLPLDKRSSHLPAFIENFGLRTYGELLDLASWLGDDYFQYLLHTQTGYVSRLTPECLGAGRRFALSPTRMENLLQNGIEIERISRENDYQGLYEALKAFDDHWKDQANVQMPFEAGANVFGYQRMYEYGRREGLSPHDAYSAFPEILRLYNASGLSADQFYHQILKQVFEDDVTYGSGSAHGEFNRICQSLNLMNVDSVLDAARRFPFVADQIAEFDTPGKVFASWPSLRKFFEVREILSNDELMTALEVEQRTNPALASWVYRLAFARRGRVSPKMVMELYQAPTEFFDRSDPQALQGQAKHLHDRKKPSNYFYFPHLDLNGPELLNSLVGGALDRLQVLPPLEVRYRAETLPDGRFLLDTSTRGQLREAFGSRTDRNHWNYANRVKLYNAVNKLFGEYRINGRDSVRRYLAGELEVPSECETRINEMLGDAALVVQHKRESVTVIARMHRKSDPEGILAGNDVPGCMPLGNGKTNIYILNPNVAQLTLQIEKNGSGPRTIAQSIVTMDMNVGRLIPEVLAAAEAPNAQITDVLPPGVVQHSATHIAVDNIEVHPNYRQPGHIDLVERVYEDFFGEYVRRFAEGLRCDAGLIPVGKESYMNDVERAGLPFGTAKRLPNTFAPLAPMGYSDKAGAEVFRLTPAERPVSPERAVDAPPIPRFENPAITVTGVSPLRFTDTLAVSYLEGKAYADNPELMEHLHNLENGLIASEINNSSKGRPHLSFKYTAPDGTVCGYLLAYEGRYRYDPQSASEGESHEPVIYISDLATDRAHHRETGAQVGRRLVRAFVEQYGNEYLAHGRLVPVYAEMRERTSFRMMRAQLAGFARNLGVGFEIEELTPKKWGTDTMNRVMIRPVPHYRWRYVDVGGEEIPARHTQPRGDQPGSLFVPHEAEVQRVVEQVALRAGRTAEEAARLSQQVSAFYYERGQNAEVDAYMRELGVPSGTFIAPDPILATNRDERIRRAGLVVHEVAHANGAGEEGAEVEQGIYHQRFDAEVPLERDVDPNAIAAQDADLRSFGIQPARRGPLSEAEKERNKARRTLEAFAGAPFISSRWLTLQDLFQPLVQSRLALPSSAAYVEGLSLILREAPILRKRDEVILAAAVRYELRQLALNPELVKYSPAYLVRAICTATWRASNLDNLYERGESLTAELRALSLPQIISMFEKGHPDPRDPEHLSRIALARGDGDVEAGRLLASLDKEFNRLPLSQFCERYGTEVGRLMTRRFINVLNREIVVREKIAELKSDPACSNWNVQQSHDRSYFLYNPARPHESTPIRWSRNNRELLNSILSSLRQERKDAEELATRPLKIEIAKAKAEAIRQTIGKVGIDTTGGSTRAELESLRGFYSGDNMSGAERPSQWEIINWPGVKENSDAVSLYAAGQHIVEVQRELRGYRLETDADELKALWEETHLGRLRTEVAREYTTVSAQVAEKMIADVRRARTSDTQLNWLEHYQGRVAESLTIYRTLGSAGEPGAKEIVKALRNIELQLNAESRQIREKIANEQRRETEHNKLEQRVGRMIRSLARRYERALGVSLGIENIVVDRENQFNRATVVPSSSAGGEGGMRMILAPRMLQLPEIGHISFTYGEDPAEASRYLKTVDLVGPHEIAHLVDGQRKHPSESLATQLTNEIGGILKEPSIQILHGENLEHHIEHHVRESFLDGLGIGMARSFGTVDRELSSREQRTAALAESFLTLGELLRSNAEIPNKGEELDAEQFLQRSLALLRIEALGQCLHAQCDEVNQADLAESVRQEETALRQRAEGLVAKSLAELGGEEVREQAITSNWYSTVVSLYRNAVEAGVQYLESMPKRKR